MSQPAGRSTAIAGNSSDQGRSVVRRAMAVLGSFSEDRHVQSLSEIQQATGLASATTYRLVTELLEWGALERVGRGRYRVGIRLWQVGSLAPQARDLRDVALPFLQDLIEVTREVAHLVVLDQGQALYLERLMARPEVQVKSRVARRLPLHATGPGKVLLAHAPTDLVERVIAAGLPRQARGTITRPDVLRRALADIRSAGYCLSRDEMTDGASSVAAPVRCATGEVIAAISVVVPSGQRDLHSLVPVTRMAAAGISRGMRLHAASP
jgi:DNA-binding IclR family transcriptional regulator